MNWVCVLTGQFAFSVASGMAGDFSCCSIGSDVQWIERQCEEIDMEVFSTYVASASERLIDEIKQVVAERSMDDWDYDGARAASEYSMIEAVRFVNRLCCDVQEPRVDVDKNGRIMLEWRPTGQSLSNITFDKGKYYCLYKREYDDDYSCTTTAQLDVALRTVVELLVR